MDIHYIVYLRYNWKVDRKCLESGPVVSVGKEYRQTLFSAQYVKYGFTNGAVVCMVTCRR